MRRILALDLATVTGWASASPDVQSIADIRHGTKTLPSSGDEVGVFLDHFDTWLNDMISVEDPALVIYEAPILTSGRTTPAVARKLMGLACHTEFVCYRRNVTVRQENIGTIKKSFAGTGRAQKEDMLRAAHAYGFNPKDHNDADACALWATALQIYKPQEHRRLFGMGLLGAGRV